MELEREPLDEQQSLALLAGMSVGRVVYTRSALPAVLPVRFRLDGDGCVVLRAQGHSELSRAVDDTVIAFEAGEIDEADGSGWSVTMVGWATVTSAPPAGDQPDTAPGEVLIRLRPELVTGQRMLVPADSPTR